MGKPRTLADTVSNGGPLADGVIGIAEVSGLQNALDAKLNVQQVGGFGFRNRIINGDMRIDQRNNGASVTPTVDPTYVVDRFYVGFSQASRMAAQQQTSVVPTGFTHAMRITVATAVTPASGDYFIVGQPIEANNVSDFGFGTANAQTVILSFRVNSSVTGTYSGVLKNGAQTRSYPFTFSIPVANTWTAISVTIPGDTTGTWLTSGNGVGIQLQICLGGGANFLGTAGVWAGSNVVGATGTTQWISTPGATFTLTGVQLEAGSVATPFERRPYGTELQLCQRYYATVSSGNRQMYRNHGFDLSTARDMKAFPLPVSMRATPTVVASGSTVDGDNGVAISGASVAAYSPNERLVLGYLAYTSQPAGGVIHNAIITATASAEL